MPETTATYADTPLIGPALLAEMKKEFEAQYDVSGKDCAFGHKYLEADSVEYASALARRGDKLQEQRVGETLHAAQKLLDPVWGGAYQYSAGGTWNETHFEKLLFIQSQVMRTYTQAYRQWGVPECLAAAQNVHRYVLLAAELPFKCVIGVEYSASLDQQARANLQARRKDANGCKHVELKHADAASYAFRGGNLVITSSIHLGLTL